MSIEDNENYYVLEEEDQEMDLDNSPLNFAAYREEDLQEEEKDLAIPGKKRSPFASLFHIMFSPVEGWKSLRRSKISPEAFQSGCFYPLLAILAVSKFADYFYSVNVSLTKIVTESVVAFVAFFFAYFCIPVVLSWLLPKKVMEIFDERFGKEYILIALSTLTLFSIITTLLPMLWPILIFLPIWTFYIMFKGTRFFKFPQKEEMKFFVLCSSAVIALPLLIDWVLNTIMPY